jgi:type VI secretion system protein ImpE
VPARYPLLTGAGNDYLLSRKTDWQDRGQEVFEGVGQRMLATDQADYPILQVRTIALD